MNKDLVSMDFHGSQAPITLSHFSKTYYMFPFSFGHLQVFLNNTLKNINRKFLFPKGNHQNVTFKAIQQILKAGYKKSYQLYLLTKITSQATESASSPGSVIARLLFLAHTVLENYLYTIYYYIMFTIHQVFPSSSCHFRFWLTLN